MEKIRLKDEQIFEIIPMGIETSAYEKVRKFSFASDLNYAEIETTFSTDNICKIEYYSEANELLKTYTDCTSLKSLSKEFSKQVEDDVISDVYSVVLEVS